MIKESNYIYAAPKIKETWKIYKLVRRQSQKGEYNSSFFKAVNGFMFRGKDMINSCFAVMKKQETQINNTDAIKFIRTGKSGGVVLHVASGFSGFLKSS